MPICVIKSMPICVVESMPLCGIFMPLCSIFQLLIQDHINIWPQCWHPIFNWSSYTELSLNRLWSLYILNNYGICWYPADHFCKQSFFIIVVIDIILRYPLAVTCLILTYSMQWSVTDVPKSRLKILPLFVIFYRCFMFHRKWFVMNMLKRNCWDLLD